MAKDTSRSARAPKVDVGELARRGNGSKGQVSDVLTEGEKVQMAVMLEKLNLLQAQLDQIRMGTSDLINTIVTGHGLDPQKYGVNLAAGRILPIEPIKPIARTVEEKQAS